MYTSRAALRTFRYIRHLSKLSGTRDRDYLCSVSVSDFVRNLSTATERSEFDNRLDGYAAENYAGNGNFDQGDRFYSSNLGEVKRKENPSGVYVYGQSLNGKDGDFISNGTPAMGNGHGAVYVETGSYGVQQGGFDGRHSEGSELNGYAQNLSVQHGDFTHGNVWDEPRNVFRQNEKLNGYSNGGIMGMPLEPGSIGGSYSRNSGMAWQNVHNTGTYQQHGADIPYSNAGNYQQNSFESQRHGFVDPQLHSGVNSSLESVQVAAESHLGGRIEHLDEFIKEGKLNEAVELLGQLLNEGVQVELPQYMALMTACGEKQALDMAKSVHEHILKSMPHLEIRTYNWILEMYVKCGSMDDLFAVFEHMPQRNLTSWDIMISALAKNGLGEDSIDLFDEFKNSGLKPDGEMFVGVFSACGVLCDIVEGMLHFESMTKDYGIHPTMEHYVSIVGMFGSAGFLDEALEFIENMPVEPTIDIWETLMKFSRIQGNVELGDRCAEFVELLDPSRLNEQSREGLIPVNPADLAREKVKKKLSSQNLADVRSKVHEYRAGDRSHPEHERIYALLGGLRQQLKECGYIPETRVVLHDIDPESKEEALMAHSERLAAAQGFMTSPARSSLRIIKNLRACIDCHNAFKILSKIVGREIIARDSKRFHHFRDGSCSCNDYW